jgi:predicted amidohydrolase YtcJ
MQNNTKADLVLINGIIRTMDLKKPTAEAVAVREGKIIYVGSTQEINSLIDKNTNLIDCNGKLVLPGFIDNHTHFVYGGFQLTGINLREAKTRKEFSQLISDFVKTNNGKWITGGDWDHEAWENKSLPTKQMIDDSTKDTPIFVTRFDGHMGLANSKALELAGITSETTNPKGGTIVKDHITAEPTGMLKDEAMNLIFRIITPPTREDKKSAVITALKHASEMGITSIQDVSSFDDIKFYTELENEGLLTSRFYCRIPIEEYSTLVDKKIRIDDTSTGFIKLGALKAFADGSIGSSTALFFDGYDEDTSNFGLAMEILQNGKLEEYSIDADKNHLQLSVHAIGDKANSEVLDIFEKVTKTNSSWDRRFRIEHAQHINPKDYPRFKKLNVIASCQPFHCIDDGQWVQKRIGYERCKNTYPFRNFIDNGIILTFGSDWTVAPLNILEGVYAAVTRRTLDGKNPEGWFPEQKISVEEAVKCYTINNAYGSFEEKVKGSISEGKFADFVILSDDIFEIDPVKIKDVKIEKTIMNGKIIYAK